MNLDIDMVERQVVANTTIGAGLLYIFSSMAQLDIATFSILNTGLLDVVIQPYGISVTWAALISVAAVIWVYLTHDRSLREFSDFQSFSLYALIVMSVAITVFPGLRSWLSASTARAFVFVVVEAVLFGELALTPAEEGVPQDTDGFFSRLGGGVGPFK